MNKFQNAISTLTSSPKTKNQMQSRFFLDIVVAQGATIFKLLSSKDETLLVWRNSFLVLDLGLDIVNGIRGLDVQGDSLASKSFYEDLYRKMESHS